MRTLTAAALVAATLGLVPLGAGAQSMTPHAAPDSLTPGLAVVYYDNFFREIRELEEWMDYKDGRAGPPLPQLDYRVGPGDVLTSGSDEGVGAHITGFIHLAETGTYTFVAQSNDGIRVEIGGEVVLEDPDVHSDRYSDFGKVEVAEPGWYPISVLYFERKNTSTLELYWRPPSVPEGTMKLVPAEAFAHAAKG